LNEFLRGADKRAAAWVSSIAKLAKGEPERGIRGKRLKAGWNNDSSILGIQNYLQNCLQTEVAP
jgi:hypothetical protein